MRRYMLAFSLVGLTFFALAHDAVADLLAEVSFNGGAFLPICTALPGGTCVGSVGVGGLVLNMAAAQSNSPGNPTLAVLLSTALSLTNTNPSGTATAHLLIGDTSWAVPTGAVTMLSHIGGSVAVGGPLNTMAFFSSFDPGTGQNVSPGTFNTPAVSPSISAAGSYDATSSVAIPLVSVPPSFAMTENLTITLSAGSIMNYSTSTTLSPSTVPEPVSLLLIGTSLIGLGVPLRRKRTVIRRRNASAHRRRRRRDDDVDGGGIAVLQGAGRIG
jgi:hypothetical protein